MFERFTDEARQVVVLAQDEARRLGHDYIGTEHLLLGLMREEGGAAGVLATCDLTLERVRDDVRGILGEGTGQPTGQIPFTPRAKRALEAALEATLALDQRDIRTEHILLGLLAGDDGVVDRVLLERRVDVRGLRLRAERAAGLERPPREPPPRPAGASPRPERSDRLTKRARNVISLAADEARALRHPYIGTEHVLLGLLGEEEGLASRVLASLDVSIEEARAQVARIVGPGDEPVEGRQPLTPRTKKVLELALREALSLGHNHIGTEHILLALVRENEGVAARILLDFDVDAERVRSTVIGMLSGSAQPRETHVRRPRRRWEYRIEPGEATLERLGELGCDGWELAAAQGDTLIFKRPR